MTVRVFNMNFLFYLWLTVDIHYVLCLPSPTYMWLLNADRGAYEVQRNTAPDSPQDNVLKLSTGPYGQEGNSAIFDGQFYVQTTLTETADFLEVSLCFFVYLESADGSLFRYDVRAREDNAVEQLEITAGGMISFSGFNINVDPIDFKKNVWQFVCFIRDAAAKNVQIQLNYNVVYEHVDDPLASVTDFLPGKIQLGSGFVGKMSCVTYYNSPVTLTDKADILKNCGLSEPKPVIKTAAVEVICTYLWPLNSVWFGLETKSLQTSPVASVKSACVRIGDSFPYQTDNSVYFDGGYLSFLDSALKLNTFQNDFSISFLVKPLSPMTGTLLHFVYKEETKGLRKLKLFARDRNLEISLTDASRLDTCGTTVLINAFVMNMWHYVGFQRKGNDITLTSKNIILGSSNQVTVSDKCVTAVANSVEVGTFRISGDLEGGDNFRGFFRCFAVFQGITNNTFDSLVNECSAIRVPSVTFDRTSCTQLSPLRDNYIKRIEVGALPNKREIPISSKVEPSLRQCAMTCVSQVKCQSFSLQRLLTAGYLCQTYDFVTRGSGLIKQLSTSYYALT